MNDKKKKAHKFFSEMTDEGYVFSKSGDNWIKMSPTPTHINIIMALGELGDELSNILDELNV